MVPRSYAPLLLFAFVLCTAGICHGQVTLRLEAEAIAVEPGATFAVDAFIDNPQGLAVGGYQIAFGFDTTRFAIASGPTLAGDSVLTSSFVGNAPAPFGAGYLSCDQWDDGLGLDVMTGLGIANDLTNGFTEITGHLFRVELVATGAAGAADTFPIAFGPFEGCLYFSTAVDTAGQNLSTSVVDGSVTISDLAPPTNLTCTTDTVAEEVTLDWTNGDIYSDIVIYRDGAPLALLFGDSITFTDTDVAFGETHSYGVAGIIASEETPRATCTVTLIPGITDLGCSFDDPDVTLGWTNGMLYDVIEVRRDGSLLELLPGNTNAYVDTAPPASGTVTYEVVGFFGPNETQPASCVVNLDGDIFLRGDADGDGIVNGLVDALFLLDYSFTGGATPSCLDAIDVDDDGALNGLVDTLYLLDFQFTGGPQPPLPFPDPGPDPTPDTISCL